MTSYNFSELRMQAGLSTDQAAVELGYSASTIYRWEKCEAAPRAAAIQALTVLARFANSGNTWTKSSRAAKFRFIDLFAGRPCRRACRKTSSGK